MAELPDFFEIPKWLYRRWVWHAAFWATFMFLLSIEEVNSEIKYENATEYWKFYVINMFEFGFSIYSCSLFGVPYLLYRKRYLLFFLFCVLVALATGWMNVAVWELMDPNIVIDGIDLTKIKPKVADGLTVGFMTTLFGSALKVIKDILITAQRRADRKAVVLEGELTALRHQISPHFLLNSLNTVYGLALTEPKSVAPTLLTLSDLLRFSLYETRTDRVLLSREIAFLHDYVAMQRLRASEKLHILWVAPESVPYPEPEIAPLLLLVFIENGFKFAQPNAQGERYLSIELRFDAPTKTLSFTCENTFSSNAAPATAGGLGLANVKRRLDLIYPNQHQLAIEQQNGRWEVKLNLHI
jgi:LytS/YehU family sensor histidine kinase